MGLSSGLGFGPKFLTVLGLSYESGMSMNKIREHGEGSP